MHRINVFLLTISFLLLSLGGIAQDDKHALIIAIGNYPDDTEWAAINSLNDVPLVKSALVQQGFREKDIVVLTEENATREGILSAIRRKLIDRAKPGGTAYFHFSGHGQQVFDDNGDEIDGFDEAIVPINSPKRYMPGVYEGENLIRDEELGALFDELRAKLGGDGHLMAVIDACHSGTGTRGFAPARGTDIKMAPPEYKVPGSRGDGGVMTKEEYKVPGSRGDGNPMAEDEYKVPGSRGGETSTGIVRPDQVSMAPMVAFFGAAPNQLNFEAHDEDGNLVGSLSYAFAKNFSTADSRTSYRALFDQIKLEMSTIAPRQQPQAEGTLDQELLGGNILGQPEYFGVSRWNDNFSITIDGGWMQGINEGSVIGLFPPDTRDLYHTEPLAVGMVSKSNPLSAVLELDEGLSKKQAKSCWAFVLQQNFGELEVLFSIDLPVSHPFYGSLKDKLEEYPVIKESDAPEVVLVEDKAAGKFRLYSKDDYLLKEVSNTLPASLAARQITDRLLAFGRAKYFRTLELSSRNVPLNMKINLVEYDRNRQEVVKNLPLASRMDADGQLRLREGDEFQIEVTNLGEKSAYFTILDIQPDNYINSLVPGETEQPTDFRLGPGQSVVVKTVFEVVPPYGTEVFKIIGTDEPIDLSPIISSRGGQTRDASPSPFEKLYQQTYQQDKTSTRGGKTISLSPNNLHVGSVSFVIEKK